jgi:hypothetical protein
MTIAKSLFVAALLSTSAAISFAQAPSAPKASVGSVPASTTVAPDTATTATAGAKKHHKHHAAKKVEAAAAAAPVTK